MSTTQTTFDFVMLNCSDLARQIKKSRGYVSLLKKYARGMPDDPFHGGPEATVTELHAWRQNHPEFRAWSKRVPKKEAA